MKKVFILLLLNFFLSLSNSNAQTRNEALIVKEAMNSFARYSSTKDIKNLENARKLIDDSYKTKSDSTAFRNNLINCKDSIKSFVMDINSSNDFV